MEHIIDFSSDFIFISETWLKSNKSNVTNYFKDCGYKFLHHIRTDSLKSRGGGVGILMKISIKARIITTRAYSSFEHILIKAPLSSTSEKSVFIFLLCVYRLQDIPIAVFFDEFSDLLSNIIKYKRFLIAGDLNIHVDENNPTSMLFSKILDQFSLKQHVTVATHSMGHTLDLIITPASYSDVRNLQVFDFKLSDHFYMNFHLIANINYCYRKTIYYRNVENVNSEYFQRDTNNALNNLQVSDFTTTVDTFHSSLQKIVDVHAPLRSKEICIKPNSPWFDAEYSALRRLRRKAEKRYRKSGSEVDKNEFKRLRYATTASANEKKRAFYKARLENCSPKVLFANINILLDEESETVYPTGSSDLEIANNFVAFFQDKVTKLRSRIPVAPCSDSAENLNISKLTSFRPTTPDEIRSIISSFPIKCSPMDPLPANLLKNYTTLFIDVWTRIVNLSFEYGSMDGLKHSVITPLLKDTICKENSDLYSNYRPITNLLFLSKLIERVVAVRIDEHMIENDLYLDCQFGYRKGHSTESLLIKVFNELLSACDISVPSIVILLDLSAAFDTVDHNKLLEILRLEIGIDGIALQWFRSFLKGRKFRTKINQTYSTEVELMFGVPQGSVLGPILFTIYIRGLYKLTEIRRAYKIEGFADDNQLTTQFLVQLQVEALGKSIADCINQVSQWMNEHFLFLNESKTKILVVAPPAIQKCISIGGVILNKSCIRFVNSAKNLGVQIDNCLSMEQQIQKVVKGCYLTIRKLSSIRCVLTQDQMKTMVCNKILSRLDYCNSLYHGLSIQLIGTLQRVQNSALRLLLKNNIPLHSPISPFFLQMHWLKVRERIRYKLLLTTHKCIINNEPRALRTLLKFTDSNRTMFLFETKVRTIYGNRCFSHAAPKLWNRLPSEIRFEIDTDTFKKRLKSFLLLNGDHLNNMLNMR